MQPVGYVLALTIYMHTLTYYMHTGREEVRGMQREVSLGPSLMQWELSAV